MEDLVLILVLFVFFLFWGNYNLEFLCPSVDLMDHYKTSLLISGKTSYTEIHLIWYQHLDTSFLSIVLVWYVFLPTSTLSLSRVFILKCVFYQ